MGRRVAHLILGSGSPRRAQLLREAGFTFERRPAPFDEAACDLRGLDAAERVQRLAEGKARALAMTPGRRLVLTADTLIALDTQPLGKPADAADARRMLQRLLGTTHQVVTGVCLVESAGGREIVSFVDVAEVTIAPLDAAALDAYINSGEWQGKAGGYNLAELRDRWRFTVAGDEATVIGLPMRRLTPMLRTAVARFDARCGSALQSPRADDS